MQPLAFNYNPQANTSAECIATIYGCMSSIALNYDSLANIDDGSCIGVNYGCTDTLAFNYALTANVDDGSCIPVIYGCINPTQFNYDVTANTNDGSCIPRIYGCMDETAFNFNNYNTDTPNVGQPVLTGADAILINVNTACGALIDLNGNFNASMSSSSEWGGGSMNYCCIEVVEGCIDQMAPNYNPLANTDDGSCEQIEDLTLTVMLSLIHI